MKRARCLQLALIPQKALCILKCMLKTRFPMMPFQAAQMKGAFLEQKGKKLAEYLHPSLLDRFRRR